MNQPTKPDSIEFLPLPTAQAYVKVWYSTAAQGASLQPANALYFTADQMHVYAEDHVLADRAHRPAVAGSVDDDVFSELLWAFKFHDDVDGNVIRREKLIAHISTLIAHERQEGKRESDAMYGACMNTAGVDALHARIAELESLIAPAAPRGEAVAQVDEGDDGLFIDIIYGPDGSDLKRGDKLYTHPAPKASSTPEAPIVLPEKPNSQWMGVVGPHRNEGVYGHSDEALTSYATAAVLKDRDQNKQEGTK